MKAQTLNEIWQDMKKLLGFKDALHQTIVHEDIKEVHVDVARGLLSTVRHAIEDSDKKDTPEGQTLLERIDNAMEKEI